MKRSILFFSLWFFILAACSEKEPDTAATRSAPLEIGQSRAELDEAKIVDWLSGKQLEYESLQSGLYYSIEDPGGKEKPGLRSLVEVHYHGTTLDGKVFDSTKNGNPIRYPLAKLIRGWQEGIPLIGKGGKITLIVPSDMAYGDRKVSPEVGPNSVLVFEIELLDFEG